MSKIVPSGHRLGSRAIIGILFGIALIVTFQQETISQLKGQFDPAAGGAIFDPAQGAIGTMADFDPFGAGPISCGTEACFGGQKCIKDITCVADCGQCKDICDAQYTQCYNAVGQPGPDNDPATQCEPEREACKKKCLEYENSAADTKPPEGCSAQEIVNYQCGDTQLNQRPCGGNYSNQADDLPCDPKCEGSQTCEIATGECYIDRAGSDGCAGTNREPDNNNICTCAGVGTQCPGNDADGNPICCNRGVNNGNMDACVKAQNGSYYCAPNGTSPSPPTTTGDSSSVSSVNSGGGGNNGGGGNGGASTGGSTGTNGGDGTLNTAGDDGGDSDSSSSQKSSSSSEDPCSIFKEPARTACNNSPCKECYFPNNPDAVPPDVSPLLNSVAIGCYCQCPNNPFPDQCNAGPAQCTSDASCKAESTCTNTVGQSLCVAPQSGEPCPSSQCCCLNIPPASSAANTPQFSSAQSNAQQSSIQNTGAAAPVAQPVAPAQPAPTQQSSSQQSSAVGGPVAAPAQPAPAQPAPTQSSQASSVLSNPGGPVAAPAQATPFAPAQPPPRPQSSSQDASSSRLSGCGNGQMEDEEECDDGNGVNGDGCTSNCALEFCGDGAVQNNERLRRTDMQGGDIPGDANAEVEQRQICLADLRCREDVICPNGADGDCAIPQCNGRAGCNAVEVLPRSEYANRWCYTEESSQLCKQHGGVCVTLAQNQRHCLHRQYVTGSTRIRLRKQLVNIQAIPGCIIDPLCYVFPEYVAGSCPSGLGIRLAPVCNADQNSCNLSIANVRCSDIDVFTGQSPAITPEGSSCIHPGEQSACIAKQNEEQDYICAALAQDQLPTCVQYTRDVAIERNERGLVTTEECDNGSVCQSRPGISCRSDEDCGFGGCVYNEQIDPTCTAQCRREVVAISSSSIAEASSASSMPEGPAPSPPLAAPVAATSPFPAPVSIPAAIGPVSAPVAAAPSATTTFPDPPASSVPTTEQQSVIPVPFTPSVAVSPAILTSTAPLAARPIASDIAIETNAPRITLSSVSTPPTTPPVAVGPVTPSAPQGPVTPPALRPSAPICGNAIVEQGEECDEGRNNSDAPNSECHTDCTYPFCGDGNVDTKLNEECDDGNEQRGDGCFQCTIERQQPQNPVTDRPAPTDIIRATEQTTEPKPTRPTQIAFTSQAVNPISNTDVMLSQSVQSPLTPNQVRGVQHIISNILPPQQLATLPPQAQQQYIAFTNQQLAALNLSPQQHQHILQYITMPSQEFPISNFQFPDSTLSLTKGPIPTQHPILYAQPSIYTQPGKGIAGDTGPAALFAIAAGAAGGIGYVRRKKRV